MGVIWLGFPNVPISATTAKGSQEKQKDIVMQHTSRVTRTSNRRLLTLLGVLVTEKMALLALLALLQRVRLANISW